MGKIYDPFFTTKLGRGGSGLGLNIVYNIVYGLLGGRIDVKSALGEGTSFILTLPIRV
jgi:signal transduction histidine kinase